MLGSNCVVVVKLLDCRERGLGFEPRSTISEIMHLLDRIGGHDLTCILPTEWSCHTVHLLLPSCDMTEIMLKQCKFSKQPNIAYVAAVGRYLIRSN